MKPSPNPWETEPEPSPALDGEPLSGYGYHTGQSPHACTREDLASKCFREPTLSLVWTPESGGLVRPESVPFLVEELARHRLADAGRKIFWSSLSLAAILILYIVWLPGPGFRAPWVLLPGFLAIWLVLAVYARIEALRTDAHAFPAARSHLRHDAWLKSQPMYYTQTLLVMLALVYLAEMLSGENAAIEAAGLVKPRVLNGEWWRLLTGALLHANMTHLWLNGGALLASGRLIEVHSRREYLPAIFLLSALMGSVASLAAYPAKTSVGASGGILGLTGFLLILGYRRRESLPPGFFRRVLVSIAATGALGIVGARVIDNAAHLGGLLTGGLLGYILERRGQIDPDPAARSAPWGYIAAVVILAGAATAVVVIRF
jgi:membrane associated rhomboid family serine protease